MSKKFSDNAYRVLARKYRPKSFSELKGQDVLVQVLSNGFKTGRIPHSILLTGIRGVGKTTSSRIIAKALNCRNRGKENYSQIEPCNICTDCNAIDTDSHPDVFEMDAASHTGVDDIREIIDQCRYLPSIGNYKIYIIDEVHMLSNNAFNALLKTLEEPPSHVIFIFATTEAKKIPLTILSRCQRFDLKRLSIEELNEHLKIILKNEGFAADDAALNIISQASEGSVRDSLSLLDQAINLSLTNVDSKITETLVRDMLGLKSRGDLFKLFEFIARGEAKESVILINKLYYDGYDPIALLQELLEINNLIIKCKISSDLINNTIIPENDFDQILNLRDNLELENLAIIWQIMLKGLDEVKKVSKAFSVLEMVIIKICYTISLVDFKSISCNDDKEFLDVKKKPEISLVKKNYKKIENFSDVLKIFHDNNDILNYYKLKEVHLVKFEKGRIELRPTEWVSKEDINQISSNLSEWSGEKWLIILSNEEGSATLNQLEEQKVQELKDHYSKNEVVSFILENYPGAEITNISKVNI